MDLINERIFLDKETCEYFVQVFESSAIKKSGREKKYGKCGVEGVIPPKFIPTFLTTNLHRLNLIPFNFKPNDSVHTFLMRRYDVGDSFPPHRDNTMDNYGSKDVRRTYRYRAFIFQLSQDNSYEGGDLVINNYTVSSRTGNCVDYDPKLEHYVTEVTYGCRYSGVFWVTRHDFNLKQSLL